MLKYSVPLQSGHSIDWSLAHPTSPHMVTVVLFYKYFDNSSDCNGFLETERKGCASLGLSGRLLVSVEGVNGTLAGSSEAIGAFILGSTELDPSVTAEEAAQRGGPGWREGVDWKLSQSPQDPFPDLRANVVKEIVGWALPPNSLRAGGGVHLSPDEFDEALEEMYRQASAPESNDEKPWVLFDVRNAYEHAVGHFSGAIPPKGVRWTTQFKQFFDKNMEEKSLKDKKVLMYCTGGVRCEKASAYLRGQGVDEVYQLKGGIHRYLEAHPDGGHFKGQNFVFDKRVAQKSSIEHDEVVGRCSECSIPFDTLHGGRMCTVCRDLVLVCDKCHDEGRSEHYCSTHEEFRGVYFTFIERFTEEELSTQKQHLEQMLKDKTRGRNSRNTIRRQITKISERIDALQSGTGKATSVDAWVPRCRACLEEGCEGNCWGFWKEGENAPVQ